MLSALSVMTYTWSRFRSKRRFDLTEVPSAMGILAYSIPELADSTTAWGMVWVSEGWTEMIAMIGLMVMMMIMVVIMLVIVMLL